MSKSFETVQSETLKFGKIEYLGIFAGLFAIIGGVQQLVHTYNTQQCDDLSYTFILGAIISTLLWVIYHYHKKGGGPLIITIIALCLLFSLLIMKIIFDKRKKRKMKKKKKKEEK